MNLFDMWAPFGMEPAPGEIRKSIKRCGMTHKQWEKKKRERKNRKKARRQK